MQDRFKFRAWDTKNKRMYYSVEQAYDYIRGNPPTPTDSFGNLLEDEDFVIEQCIGFKDYWGCLIYENDIVDVTNEKYLVRYNNLDGVFELIDKNGFCEIHGSKHFYELTSILGNIHENPELLEKE